MDNAAPTPPPPRWVAVNPYYARKLGVYATEALAWAAIDALTEKQRRKYVCPFNGEGRLDVMTEQQFNEIVGRLQAMDDDQEAEEIIYWVLGRN